MKKNKCYIYLCTKCTYCIKWFKKHPTVSLVILLCLIPVSINLLFLCPLFDWGGGDDNGWLGFWGGYLGVVVSALGAYDAYKRYMEDNKRKAKPYFSFKFMSHLDDSDKKAIKIVYNQQLATNERNASLENQVKKNREDIKDLVDNVLKNNTTILVCRVKIENPISDVHIILESNIFKGTVDGAMTLEHDYYNLDWVDDRDVLFFVPEKYFKDVQLYNEITDDISEITISYIDYMGIRRCLKRVISKNKGIHTILSENINSEVENNDTANKPKKNYGTVVTNFNDFIK